jgi:hypothetical protein
MSVASLRQFADFTKPEHLTKPNEGDCELLTQPVAQPNEQLLIRSRSVVSRLVGGETLVVPVRGKVGDLASIYSFNGTGSLIWQLLETPISLADLILVVEHEYAVGEEQARKDVMKFVEDMFAVGLVQVSQNVAVVAAASNQAMWEANASR